MGTQQELSNKYQHDRVQMIFKDLCIIVLQEKVASALEGLSRVACSQLDINLSISYINVFSLWFVFLIRPVSLVKMNCNFCHYYESNQYDTVVIEREAQFCPCQHHSLWNSRTPINKRDAQCHCREGEGRKYCGQKV